MCHLALLSTLATELAEMRAGLCVRAARRLLSSRVLQARLDNIRSEMEKEGSKARQRKNSF